jgi:hypothetical protein
MDACIRLDKGRSVRCTDAIRGVGGEGGRACVPTHVARALVCRASIYGVLEARE